MIKLFSKPTNEYFCGNMVQRGDDLEPCGRKALYMTEGKYVCRSCLTFLKVVSEVTWKPIPITNQIQVMD